MKFQDGCGKYLTFNKLTVVTLERSLMNKESKLPTL